LYNDCVLLGKLDVLRCRCQSVRSIVSAVQLWHVRDVKCWRWGRKKSLRAGLAFDAGVCGLRKIRLD